MKKYKKPKLTKHAELKSITFSREGYNVSKNPRTGEVTTFWRDRDTGDMGINKK